MTQTATNTGVDICAALRPSRRRPWIGRRCAAANLILSLTIVVIVATWYGGRGLSLLPIGVLVLTLPLIIGSSRIVAARRQRLKYDLLRRPLRAGLGPQRLQLANVVLLCALLAPTVHAGAYNPVALQLTLGLHRVLLIGSCSAWSPSCCCVCCRCAGCGSARTW